MILFHNNVRQEYQHKTSRYVDVNSMPEPTNNNVKLQAPPPPPQHSLGATMKEKGNEEESYYDNE